MEGRRHILQAVILAAGEGKRLRPLTHKVCKPLLPIGGRPVIEQLIQNLREVGIRKIGVVVGHLGRQVFDFLEDGSRYEVRLTYREQKIRSGTAQALQLMDDLVNGDVLVVAGDTVFSPEHLQRVVDYFYREDCDLTLSLKHLDPAGIMAACTVRLEPDGRISAIVEKPRADQILSDVAAAPLYLSRRLIFDYLPRVERSERGEFEIQSAIQLMIDDGLQVKGIFAGNAPSLTNLEDLLRLNFDYLSSILPPGGLVERETRNTSPRAPKEE